LEQVTARLESVEKQIASGSFASAPSVGHSSAASGDGDALAAFVGEYDSLVAQFIKPLVDTTSKIGNDELKKQVALVEKAVAAQRDFLVLASKSKKPDQAALEKLYQPTANLLNEVVNVREKARGNKQFNHLSTLSEGIPALNWVLVSPTPGPFVDEARASSEFYSNKLLVEFKKSDPTQIEWVQSWNNFLKELRVYIKKFHTTELTWNPRGGDASSASAAAPAPAPARAAGGPPPPPGPPPALDFTPKSGGGGGGPDASALFAEINKGGAITAGLKKVTKDMKTSNRADKTSVVKADASKPATSTKAAASAKKGPPKIALEGNKWVVENTDNNSNIEIKDTEPKHAVYIYKCDHSVVKINGKVNSIVLDNCKRTGVVFDTAIATFEIVNCTSVEVQVTGKVPNLAIDKSQGVQVILSASSLDSEIVSSKSSEMNVLIPGPTANDDPVELAVPEQYKTVIKNGKLITHTVEHV